MSTGLSGPLGITLDLAAGKMYWSDDGNDKISRANLDGSGVEDLVTTGLDIPVGMDLGDPLQTLSYAITLGNTGGAFAIDSATGEIAWPVILKREKYRYLRTQVERLVRENARHHAAGLVNEIERETSRLRREVRRDISDFERADYHIAQKFLIGLKCEAKFPRSNLVNADLVTRPPSHGSALSLR